MSIPLTKNCVTCKVEKPLSDFNKNKSKKDGLNNVCRECNKLRSAKYYADNRETHRKNVVARSRHVVKTNREWFRTYKSALSCVECGENRTPTLDFHHTDPSTKEYTVASMIGNGCAQATILNELNKCIVLCSNCHRMLHYEMDR